MLKLVTKTAIITASFICPNELVHSEVVNVAEFSSAAYVATYGGIMVSENGRNSGFI